MSYTVDYFNQRVLDEVESWPVGILADYARLVELLIEFGPDLRMPHSRTMGGGATPGGSPGPLVFTLNMAMPFWSVFPVAT